MELDPLETAVLRKLLDGNDPTLVSLRKQLEGLSVKARERTPAGFFTKFIAPSTGVRAECTEGKLIFGDVEATIAGMQHGAGFLLYVEHGLLQMLEGYSYEENWPREIAEFSLRYSDPQRKALVAMLSG
jgi:hypothetical protein